VNTVVLNNKPSQTNNTINNNKESEKQSSPNNINNILYNRERVNSLQYVNISLNNKLDNKTLLGLTDTISIRVPLLYKLLFKEIRKDPLKWRVFKESLLSLIKSISESNIELNTTVNIQLSPNIIINNVKAEAKAESRPEINIDLKGIVKLVERLYHLSIDNPRMPPLQKDLIKQLYRKISTVVN